MGTMGQYSSNMGMVLGSFLLLSFLAGFCTFACGARDFAPTRKDYTPFASLFRFVVAFPLQSSTFCFVTFIFYFLSFAMYFLSDVGKEGD